MNIIISTNDHPTYYGFLDPICKYYKSLNHNVYVAYLTDKNTNPDIECDKIVRIKSLNVFNNGVQAKLARSYLACILEDDIYTLLDIDQILINIKWLENIIKKNRNVLLSGDKDILAIGSNVYKKTDSAGKWPMYFTTGLPSGFRKLFGITKECSFNDLLNKFAHINDGIDGSESTSKCFKNFSDESLFRYCSIRNNINIIHEDIPIFSNGINRIDRTNYNVGKYGNKGYSSNFWNQKCLTLPQRENIMNGFFLDSFPARPYERYKRLIDDIIRISLERNNET